MYKDDEHPVYQSDVITTDGLISATDLGDVITATIDSTWIYDNTISVGGAGCVLTSTVKPSGVEEGVLLSSPPRFAELRVLNWLKICFLGGTVCCPSHRHGPANQVRAIRICLESRPESFLRLPFSA